MLSNLYDENNPEEVALHIKIPQNLLLLFLYCLIKTIMDLSIDQKDIDKFLMIGDKVLIKPKNPQSRTQSGLYLPPTVQEGEKIQAGYIIKAGPGYPLPSQVEEDEVWKKKKEEQVHYLPLQAREGDLAIYLQNASFEIVFNKEKYLIVPHSAILMLVRDEGLFE